MSVATPPPPCSFLYLTGMRPPIRASRSPSACRTMQSRAAAALPRGPAIFRLALAAHCPNSCRMGVLSSGPRILAVLGPTNTGKTHLAIERMLGHQSGMIGFPLRLLARENYDRIVRLKGARAVALITGEGKIVPPSPSYFGCTVESIPLYRPVGLLAIDEIQLCAG